MKTFIKKWALKPMHVLLQLLLLAGGGLKRLIIRQITPLLLIALAATCIWGGRKLQTVEPAQVTFYNLGMKAYAEEDTDKAIDMLERSGKAYEQSTKAPRVVSMVLGRPSTRLAAMAIGHKGNLLLLKSQQEQRPGLMGEAIEQLQVALSKNPGQPYAPDVTAEEGKQMNEEALVWIHDLDIIYAKHKEQQQQAKGDGDGDGKKDKKPSKGKPKSKKDKEAPGQQPSDKASHEQDNEL
jgi:outer membrane protein assembly factor BamD (BamD/ComL family)